MASVHREDTAIIGVKPSDFAARAVAIRARLRGEVSPEPMSLPLAYVKPEIPPIPTWPAEVIVLHSMLAMVRRRRLFTAPIEEIAGGYRIQAIQSAVVEVFAPITLNDMLSARRTANVVAPRQIAMAIAKHLTLRSLPEIGRRFGGRDHTTALHAIRKFQWLIDRVSAGMTPSSTVLEWAYAMKAGLEQGK